MSFSELPVNIVKPLQDQTALEKSRVILDCTVSNPRCSIHWYKGCTVILPSERFEICSEGGYRKLIIQQVALDDAGTYSVQVGEYTCSARLTVDGERGHELQAQHKHMLLWDERVTVKQSVGSRDMWLKGAISRFLFCFSNAN